MEDFVEEATLFAKIRPHINIVQFLGVCKSPLCAVAEYCSGGSLRSYIKLESEQINENLELFWIVGIAAGMSHLAREGIVHRDLACRNVLLTATLDPKITDFGLSKALGKEGFV